MWFHFIRKLINVYMHDNNVSCAWKIDFAFKGKKERLFTLQARNAYEVSIKKKRKLPYSSIFHLIYLQTDEHNEREHVQSTGKSDLETGCMTF